MILPQLPYFSVEKVLSTAGGSGIVYWGIDMRTHYAVAIKELYASHTHNPQLVEAFRQEANSYAYLDHPNITRLIDFVVWKNRCFLVMEYLRGETIEQMIRNRTGLLPETKAIPLFKTVLDTIDFIHHVQTPIYPHGALHLDIKPSNIMLLTNGNIKVMDMGISAKISDNTMQQRVVGTPAFMPPEQFEKRQLGAYTDVFALGVTLYFMLTAHLPYAGHTYQEIWNNIKEQNFLPPQVYYPYMNPGWKHFFQKCLASDYRQRFQNCSELRNAINAMSL